VGNVIMNSCICYAMLLAKTKKAVTANREAGRESALAT
jgi:hypothetical protein